MSTSPSLAPSFRTRTEPRQHLRVAIVQGRRIVEERVFRAAAPITIGPLPGDTFIVPPDVLARPWRLFEERRGRLVLRLAAEMTARVAAASDVSTFDAASAEALRAIVLPEGARGKVTLGDTTILFQRVRPPAPQPRPQLPVSVRRHVLAELDLPFAAIVALTFLLHVGVVVYLRQVDWPRKLAVDELPDRFVHEILKRPRPAPPKVVPAPLATTPSRPRPAPKTPTVNVAARAPKPAETEAERRARLAKEVQKMGFVALLTSRGDGASATRDVLDRGVAVQSIDDAFKGVNRVTVAGDDTLRLPRVGGGTGKVATPAGLRVGPGISEATNVGPAVERGAKTNVREGAPSVEGGHVDPAAIAREIRGRRKAIAACYERALKQQPALAGKLVVRFSLTAAGTVSAVDVDDDTLGAPDVAACIRAVVLRWRFAALAEGPAELSFPFVFQPGS
jgi:hypothetical protein